MVVVYVKKGDGKLEELGRTEVILNCLNLVWIEKVTVSYHFETEQPLIFHVYDVDTKLELEMRISNKWRFLMLRMSDCQVQQVVSLPTHCTVYSYERTVERSRSYAWRGMFRRISGLARLRVVLIFCSSDSGVAHRCWRLSVRATFLFQ